MLTTFLQNLTPFGTTFNIFTIAVILWSLFWKAWSLWLAARRGQKVWFAILLIVNTLGLLEIIYIFAIARRKDTITAK